MHEKGAFKKPDIIWSTIIVIALAIMVVALFSNIIKTQPIAFGVSQGVSYMGFSTMLFTGKSPLNSTSTASEVSFVNYGELSFAFILISIILAFIAIFARKISIAAAISSLISFALSLASLDMFTDYVNSNGGLGVGIIPGTGIYLMLLAGIILIWAYYLFGVYAVNASRKTKKEAEQPPAVEKATPEGEPNKSEDIKKQISEDVNKEITSKKETETENKITLKN